MGQYRKKPLSWIFVSRMMGIIFFLIVVVLANFLTYYVTNSFYISCVTFLNENFWLLIILAVTLLVGDIFGVFSFPLNLPAPIIKAIGSVFFIVFVLHMIGWVDSIAATDFHTPFWYISFILVPLVFLIVLATGYYYILRQLGRGPGAQYKVADEIFNGDSEYTDPTLRPLPDAKSWEEIGGELRLMVFDIIHRFRADIRRKNKK